MLEIDFLDILGYIGMGIVSAGGMLALCMFLCRRHQTMLYGENVLKRQGGEQKTAVGDGDEDEKLIVNKEAPNGEWVMKFNVVKSRSRVEWNNAFLFSIVEVCIAASLLLFLYTSFSLFKSVGLGVLIGGAVFSFMVIGGKIATKISGEFKSRYMIFTLISCSVTGTIITFLLIKWGLFNLL